MREASRGFKEASKNLQEANLARRPGGSSILKVSRGLPETIQEASRGFKRLPRGYKRLPRGFKRPQEASRGFKRPSRANLTHRREGLEA